MPCFGAAKALRMPALCRDGEAIDATTGVDAD